MTNYCYPVIEVLKEMGANYFLTELLKRKGELKEDEGVQIHSIDEANGTMTAIILDREETPVRIVFYRCACERLSEIDGMIHTTDDKLDIYDIK